MKDTGKATGCGYWVLVWVLPLLALIASQVALLSALYWDGGSDIYSKLGGLCVAFGVVGEAYILQPVYEYQEGWLVPKSPRSRKVSRFRMEGVILVMCIFHGTIQWAFGEDIVIALRALGDWIDQCK